MKYKIIGIVLVSAFFLSSKIVRADILHYDDVITTGSHCVGFDCADGEGFGYDTIKLKENNLRIYIEDTSIGSFPSNDWRFLFNDTTSGGANYFAIQDATNSRTPFTIEANAPANSLYVEDYGRVGLGTAIPYVELHIVDGDSPTVRLDQDSSSGWAAQSWDVCGNETNFFIRDVTNGSSLPFRIRPGAPTSSIDIRANGDIDFGTYWTIAPDTAPYNSFNIKKSGLALAYLESSDNNAVQFRFKTNSENRRFLAVDSTDTPKSQLLFGDGKVELAGQTDSADLFARFDSTGLYVNGSINTPGGTVNVPDYVFKDDYELMPLESLKSFIDKNNHLPEIPSAEDVKKDGINITEMQIKLLKKVEELTLYTLNQHEKIEKQQNMIESLQNQISNLSNRNN